MASPSRRLKRTASGLGDEAGPSTGAGRSRTTSTSPFRPDYTSSSATPSPVKRLSVCSASRRNSRPSRTFQIADDSDDDQDAPYDEELDADGEYDEEYLDQDAPAEDDEDVLNVDEQAGSERTAAPSSSTSTTASARPKRSNAPNVSYYAVQPLPSLSEDEKDGEVTPSIRRRARKTKLPPTSDIDADDDPGPAPIRSASRSTRTHTPSSSKHALGKVPRQPAGTESSTKTVEPEMSEEAKQQAKAEKEAHDLQSRWTEEYFEIVEQLPLEMHRTFALMRELEGQMQARVGMMVQNMTTYRDVRLHMQKRMDTPSQKPRHAQIEGAGRGGSEDEAENLLGGSQEGHTNGQRPTPEGEGDTDDNLAVDGSEGAHLLDKDARRELLRSISLAANESVKAAEEKMGLAATAYNSIDRHIRRLDADISKLESSILLGLRTGTEESRGAREALGLPVDDDAAAAGVEGEDGQGPSTEGGVSAEAESAALTKAAGAANRASGSGAELIGRRSSRTTPKVGGQAQLAPSPSSSERAATRSRSRSASTSAGAAEAKRPKTASPAPPAARTTTRKRKPKPLSPQKGGRRSIVTTTSTVISPTTQTPRPSAVVGPDTSELPFDPTEPTYCYCDQISFDEMVACDNDDCSLEWFHYACVGLTKPPKKKQWYCRFCAPPGWKGEGMGVPPNAKHKPVGFKKGVGIRP